MVKLSKVFLIFLLLSTLLSPIQSSGFPGKSEAFDFTLTNGMIVNLSEFQDKPIVLDWTASWCGLCKENLRVFRSVYNDFKDFAYFITLGFTRSGDDLDIIRDIERTEGRGWYFGFDHTNYADIAEASNADVWIMDKELNIKYSWDEAIITKSDFTSKLKKVIGNITRVITTDNTLITSTISFDKYDNEINTFGLSGNPLFLGFIVLSSALTLIIIIVKRKS